MKSGKNLFLLVMVVPAVLMLCVAPVQSRGPSDAFSGSVYETKDLKPVDSVLKVGVGDRAPDFDLPNLWGTRTSLEEFRGRNVVISFVPAAWTPICSDQWPGYNILRDVFAGYNAVLLGITVDNVPSLYAWTKQMGDLWFPVLSDFWPHGEVADRFGVLRSDGTSERAIIVVDGDGIIRFIDVHDINKRPPLEMIVRELQKLSGDK